MTTAPTSRARVARLRRAQAMVCAAALAQAARHETMLRQRRFQLADMRPQAMVGRGVQAADSLRAVGAFADRVDSARAIVMDELAMAAAARSAAQRVYGRADHIAEMSARRAREEAANVAQALDERRAGAALPARRAWEGDA